MSNHHFDSSKLMCIHGRARGGCAECIEFYKKCDHGQLARTCLLCEMRDENLALRALVAELNEARNYATNLFRLLAPQCEPLATVPGLLTQIDNWCAGAKSDLADCQFRGVGAKVTLVRHRAPSRPRFAVKRVILDDIK